MADAKSIKQILKRLGGYARPYLAIIIAATLFVVLFAAARHGRAFLMKPLLDEIILPVVTAEQGVESDATASPLATANLPEHQSKPVSEASAPISLMDARFQRIIGAALLIILIGPIGMFGHAYLMQYVQGRIGVDIRRELAVKLLALPLSFHREAGSGDTLSRILGDVSINQKAIELTLSNMLESVVMVLIGLTTLFIISPALAGVSMVAAPAVAFVLVVFSNPIRRSAKRRQEQMGEVTQRLMTILSGIKVIKAFRGEDVENAVFRRETERLFKRVLKASRNRIGSKALVEMVNSLLVVGVLGLGAILLMNGRWGISAGDLVAFGAVLMTTTKPLKVVASGWNEIVESVASAERFFEILDTPEDVENPPDAVAIDGVRERIRFRNVSFRYGDQQVLENVSLELQRGQVVAVVGRTGSGKTTLVDLLQRFNEPDEGSIEIDGVDLRRLTRESVLDLTAVVSQEPFLFDTTIRENIRYGRRDASEEAILDAARAAHVDEFVDQLPDGYDTEVGEFGMRLSGGQRQRITIARAMLKNPAIFILDEATSALDAKTERIVHDAIDAMRANRIVLVIAHRLSTIRRADRIVMLEDGSVSEVGTHEELLQSGRLYSELVALQTDLAPLEGS